MSDQDEFQSIIARVSNAGDPVNELRSLLLLQVGIGQMSLTTPFLKSTSLASQAWAMEQQTL